MAGAGSGSFWWKIDCEPNDPDEGEDGWYDYAAFAIDGVEVAKIAGRTDWARVEFSVSGAGEHTLTWTFTRDDYDEDDADYANAAWVDALAWKAAPVVKEWTLAEAVQCDGACTVEISTGGAAHWAIDETDGLSAAKPSAKSGAVASGEESWIEATVTGAGTLAFSWKVMGGAYRGKAFAYAKVEVDGEERAQATTTDGAWAAQTLTIEGAGRHTVRWTYLRTSERAAEGDCAWLDGVAWTPDAEEAVVVDAGDGKTVAVPTAWLAEHGLAADGGAVATSATLPAANGRPAWQCYVLGLDPAKADDDFRITGFTIENGVPRITYEPGGATLTPGGDAKIGPLNLQIKLKGKANLGDDWRDVPSAGDATFRFFTVEVELK